MGEYQPSEQVERAEVDGVGVQLRNTKHTGVKQGAPDFARQLRAQRDVRDARLAKAVQRQLLRAKLAARWRKYELVEVAVGAVVKSLDRMREDHPEAKSVRARRRDLVNFPISNQAA